MNRGLPRKRSAQFIRRGGLASQRASADDAFVDDAIDDLIADLWDLSDPAQSEARFAAAVQSARDAGDAERTLALLTQQARAVGLQKHFDDAQQLLNEVKRRLDGTADGMFAAVRVRWLLEQGRVLNSSGKPDTARSFFEEAWNRTRGGGFDALAVDAAHMVAITHSAGEEALEWNQRALELAEASAEPRARRWRGSLHNNLGWVFHDRGDYSSALRHFQQALDARMEQAHTREALIARWCIARCRRSMGECEYALREQMQLRDDWERMGETDGFVIEEIAECLHALGRVDEAGPYFAQAHELLKFHDWIEPERLQRLAQLAGK